MKETGKKKRTSLTKAQRQSEEGIKLISLCQSFMEDGRISDEEIYALKQWLEANKACGFPAIDFLSETIEQILKDGKITREEQETIYKALEKVLPPDLRKDVIGKRCKDKTLKWNFMVAGTRYENRSEIISKYVKPNDTAYLQREYNNKYSKNAIKVLSQNGEMIGYVPELLAVQIAPFLDKGYRAKGFFTKVLCPKLYHLIPVVDLSLYPPETSVEGALSQEEIITKFERKAKKDKVSVGWKYILVAVVVLILLAKFC